MVKILKYNAKLIKILIILGVQLITGSLCFSQDDPISQAVVKEQRQIEGMNITQKEQKDLDKINTKYTISDKEKDARLKRERNQKLGMRDKYRMGRANRKDYMREKKLEEFNRNLILNRQGSKTKERMLENEKKIKKRDKEIKRKKKRKKFFNLFR